MFKIIVGGNDRDEALDALRLAREIALVEGAEVVAAAAFVFEYPYLDLAYPEAHESFLFEDGEARGDHSWRHRVHACPDPGPPRPMESSGSRRMSPRT